MVLGRIDRVILVGLRAKNLSSYRVRELREMEFDPRNNIIQLCIQGMAMEDQSNADEASKLFLQAWNESTNDFEKFIAAYYVARVQKDVRDRLKWLETALQFGEKVNEISATSAFPALYSAIAKCHEELGDLDAL